MAQYSGPGLPLEYNFSKPPNSYAGSPEASDHLEIESPDSRIVLLRNAYQVHPLSIETLARLLLSCALVGTATGSLPWETGFRSHPTPSRTQSPTWPQEQCQELSTTLLDNDGTSSSSPRRKRARDLLAGDDSYPAKRPRLLSGVCLMQVTDGVRNFVRYDDGFWREEDETPLLVRFDIGDIYKRLVLRLCSDRGFEVPVLKWCEEWGAFCGYDAAAGTDVFLPKHVVNQMIWGQNIHWPGLTLADDCL